MNKYIIVTIVAVIALAGGALLYNSKKPTDTTGQEGGHGMEETSNKPVAQSHRSYSMDITRETPNKVPGQPVSFTYTIKNDKEEVLKDYETVHEKKMHFIVVREDLQNFQHLHPEFNENSGEWTVDVIFPSGGPYRIFPDFTPGKSADNPQLLPVTVNSRVDVGDMAKYKAQPLVVDTSPTKTVDGYAINYKLSPQQPKAQSDFTYTLTVNKNGQPVINLDTYLGALGHSVILREGTLDFIHTHAGEASAGNNQGAIEHGGAMMGSTGTKGPDINFSTTLPESGVYKIFTQFQHQGKVQTTDYVINVQ